MLEPGSFAVDLNRDDHAAALEVLAGVTAWTKPEGRSYFMAVAGQHPLLAGCRRAFFLKIYPGGVIHPHTDAGASEAFDTDLIVVSTNKQCRTFWQVENNTFSMRLELGRRYRMVDRGTVHWSVNNGATERTHLLIEYPK